MAKLTLGSVKATIAEALGKSTGSTEVTRLINEAQERLVEMDDWLGTVVRYRFCANYAKLTWPHWAEGVRKINVCNQTTPIANRWYEFVGVGPGTLHDTDNPGLVCQDMGQAPTFGDISGENKKLYVKSDEAESSGLYLVAQGYDDDNKWVRTTQDGSLADGERITIDSTGNTSTTVFANVSGIRISGTTTGTVTLSEYDTSYGTYTPIGQYEPGELRPLYSRIRIPGLAAYDNCGCSDDPCETGFTSVMAMLKLKHVTLSDDNDWLILQSLPALKNMVLSIKYEESERPDKAEYFKAKAVDILDKQLANHHKGESFPNHDIQDRYIWGAGSIEGVV